MTLEGFLFYYIHLILKVKRYLFFSFSLRPFFWSAMSGTTSLLFSEALGWPRT